MPSYAFDLPRLLVDQPLAAAVELSLDKAQANYLGNVLRARPGDEVLLFNGRDGEWLARVEAEGTNARRPKLSLAITEQTRPQPDRDKPALRYLFAPLKQARQDYMVQKAVEMGATALCPVRTDRTQISRVNEDRLTANMREACEQCGVIAVPAAEPLVPLSQVADIAAPEIVGGPALVFCDERAAVQDPAKVLARISSDQPISVLIGPEGGFSDAERDMLLALPHAVPIAIGPRILRADTAAVAALTAVQMVWGDWRG